MNKGMLDQQILDDIIRRIVEVAQPEKIILFGSAARGEMNRLRGEEQIMKKPILTDDKLDAQYQVIFGDVSRIVDAARQSAARSVNAVMTAAYWLIGRHIVEFEQSGEQRADYGEEIVERLATDLSAHYGRGFSIRNVWNMKAFYLAWPIPQTVSAESESSGNLQIVSGESSLASVASHFPLPWSAYVQLLSVKNAHSRESYETKAIHGGNDDDGGV